MYTTTTSNKLTLMVCTISLLTYNESIQNEQEQYVQAVLQHKIMLLSKTRPQYWATVNR